MSLLRDNVLLTLRLVLGSFFRSIRVQGLENVPQDRGGILVSWHVSGVIDPALMVNTFPREVAFGARHGLLKIPVIGKIMDEMGTVPIYRAEDLESLSPEQRLRFTPEELVERLVALVPPPRANQVVYRGVLAAHAAMRREVVPKGDEPDRPPAPPTGIELGPLSKKPKASIGHTQMTWAQILWRVFEVSGWHCSVCGEKMHLRHVMEGGPTTKSVLAGLMKAAAPP